jgi:hypothetical protein
MTASDNKNLERWRTAFPIIELERPAGFKTHERVHEAVERLAARLTLHPRAMTPVLIVPARYLPQGLQGSFDPKLNVIRVCLSALHPALAAVHEIMHALDARQDATWHSSHALHWQERVSASPAMKRLELYDGRTVYYRRTHELFARLMEQWMAAEFLEEWADQSAIGAEQGLYWLPQEFETIRPRFERALRTCGVTIKRVQDSNGAAKVP